MPQPSQLKNLKAPWQPDRVLSTLWIQLIVAGVVAAIVAAFTRQDAGKVSFFTTIVVAGFLTFIIVNFIRTVLLLPPRQEDVSQTDPARLTGSITSALRSTYAISSNWISLWQTPNFRYYLHLDAVASLIAYSFRFNSSLHRLSKNEDDLDEFWQEGLDLLDKIAADKAPVYKHRVRLLIYPLWVYDKHQSDIDQLIRSHSAARIPCIPLVAEELYRRMPREEHEAVGTLVSDLNQSVLDKTQPRPIISEWFIRRRIRRNKRIRDTWKVVFPDMLLVDAGLSHDTAAVWWYSGNGEVTRRGYDDESDEYGRAEEAFRLICKHSRQALWNDYTADKLGGVAIAATSGQLESEVFFGREYYSRWLSWIDEHKVDNNHARDLSKWITAERQRLASFVADAITKQQATQTSAQNGNGTVQLLDVGCGIGADIVDLLRSNSNLHAVGVDIIERNVTEGYRRIHNAQLEDRAALVLGDAESLADFGENEFDIAICMTNTLGNLTPEKQERFIRRLCNVLKPTGKVFISVYGKESVAARLASYKAIGLNVADRDSYIEAAEGLRSQHFTEIGLRSLLENNGLKLADGVDEVARIGLTAVASPKQKQ